MYNQEAFVMTLDEIKIQLKTEAGSFYGMLPIVDPAIIRAKFDLVKELVVQFISTKHTESLSDYIAINSLGYATNTELDRALSGDFQAFERLKGITKDAVNALLR